ncbi:hypothetical protein AB0K08_13670 [Citricoccus sp. NPDC055426]|uniref:hypothetical protein n=1 Tax=Citricoccus sp. NPDC055426 TaxID=3155536 RepID=UPI003424B405
MTTAKTATDVATILHKHLDAPISTEDARNIATALGLTVAPEKPKPGLYLFDGRFPVIIDGDGDWWNLTLGSDPGMAYEDTPGEPRHLTPARVVPAEPPVLTSSTSLLDEAQMQEDASVEWAAYRKDYGPKDTATAHKAFHAGYRAALAKHDGARELPGRDEVEEAIHNALGKHDSNACRRASVAVMEVIRRG